MTTRAEDSASIDEDEKDQKTSMHKRVSHAHIRYKKE